MHTDAIAPAPRRARPTSAAPLFAAGAERPARLYGTGLIGKTKLYEDMKAKRLKFVKNGRSTLILEADWNRYLRSMPAGELAGSQTLVEEAA